MIRTSLAVSSVLLLVLGLSCAHDRAKIDGPSGALISARSDNGGTDDPVGYPLLPGDIFSASTTVAPMDEGASAISLARILKNEGETRYQLLVIFEPWCPASLATVDALEQMARLPLFDSVGITALTRAASEETSRALGGMTPKRIRVIADVDPKIYDLFMPATGVREVPFAAILQKRKEGGHSVLWMGAADGFSQDSNLLQSLKEIQDGTFDETAHRKRAKAAKSCDAALDDVGVEFEIAWKERDLDGLRNLASQLSKAASFPGCELTVVTALNDAAWTLLTDESPADGQLEIGLAIAEEAMNAGGGNHHAAVDTYARGLFENGQNVKAFRAERQAITMAGFPIPEYMEALGIYAAAACEDGVKEACSFSAYIEKSPKEPGSFGPSQEQHAAHISEEISRESAKEDLLYLHSFLKGHYAAYDDAAATLATKGSSWKKRLSRFLRRLDEKSTWSFDDFRLVVIDLLSFIDDRHLVVGTPEGKWFYPTSAVEPYFVDVVVEKKGETFRIAAAPRDPALLGREIIPPPKVPSPFEAKLEKPYLFPTVAPDYGSSRKPGPHYLLGILSESAAPWDLPLNFASEEHPQKNLPLHRGRFRVEPHYETTWKLVHRGLPMLRIADLSGDLTGMPESAKSLREKPAFAVDLRGNGGGADSHTIEFFVRLSNQDFVFYQGAASFHGEHQSPLKRWSCEVDVRLPASKGGRDAIPAKPYEGRMIILMDKGSASAAEVFAGLGEQLADSVTIGENTAGALSYGNVDQEVTLPGSGLWIRVGRTKFLLAGKGGKEAFGLFPDFWIDESPYDLDLRRFTKNSSR